MSSQPHRIYTLEEYFELDRASDTRYEFWNGEIFAMSGASPAHAQILVNLIITIGMQLRGRSCRVFPSDVRVKIPSLPPYRYPDLTALCGSPEFEPIGGIDALTNPSLIIEVLSPSTEAYDRGDKFTHYKSIESFGEYVLLAQHRPHAAHYIKHENGLWMFEEVNDLGDVFHLVTIDCQLTMREIYQDVEFTLQSEPSLEKI